MNAQEIYKKVASHLRRQGRPAQQAGECLFVAPDGARCAIGCLLPDEITYDDHLDVEVTEHVIDMLGLTEHMSLLFSLQDVHDSCAVRDGRFQADDLERRLQAVEDGLSSESSVGWLWSGAEV